jgi:hypothetical protein
MDENLEVRITHRIEPWGLTVNAPPHARPIREDDLKALVWAQSVPRETDDLAIPITRPDGADHQVEAGGKGSVANPEEPRMKTRFQWRPKGEHRARQGDHEDPDGKAKADPPVDLESAWFQSHRQRPRPRISGGAVTAAVVNNYRRS